MFEILKKNWYFKLSQEWMYRIHLGLTFFKNMRMYMNSFRWTDMILLLLV